MKKSVGIKNRWYQLAVQVLLFIAFSIMFFPGGLEYISPGLFFAVDRLKLPVSLLLVVCPVLLGKSRLKVPYPLIITLALYGFLIAVSFFRNTNWHLLVKEALLALSIMVLITYNRNNTIKVLSPLLAALEWQIYLNLVTIFMFPRGMYQEALSGNVSNWLLGYDNSWNYVFFPALFIAIVCRFLSGNKKRFWLLLFAMEFQSFCRFSIMCSFGFVIFDLLFLLRFYKGKIFNIRNYAIGAAIAMIIVLFFRDSIPILESLGTLIGKDIHSMSNRSVIWMQAVELIKAKPILGYGRISALDVAQYYYQNKDAVHAHNMPLELLFRGGIVFLSIYLGGVVISVKAILRNRDEELAQVLSIAYLSVFLMMITQVYLSPLSIFMILLGGFSKQFITEACLNSDLSRLKKRRFRIRTTKKVKILAGKA